MIQCGTKVNFINVIHVCMPHYYMRNDEYQMLQYATYFHLFISTLNVKNNKACCIL